MGSPSAQEHHLRQIVSDTGPVLHLTEAGAADLIAHAGTVIIPPAVDRELSRYLPDRPPWLHVQSVAASHLGEVAAWQRAGVLGAGETEALALSQQLGADWFLTDDAAARWVAQQRGIEVHGSLGILIWAARAGVLGRAEAFGLLERLEESTLWIARPLRAEIRTLLDAVFPHDP